MDKKNISSPSGDYRSSPGRRLVWDWDRARDLDETLGPVKEFGYRVTYLRDARHFMRPYVLCCGTEEVLSLDFRRMEARVRRMRAAYDNDWDMTFIRDVALFVDDEELRRASHRRHMRALWVAIFILVAAAYSLAIFFPYWDGIFIVTGALIGIAWALGQVIWDNR